MCENVELTLLELAQIGLGVKTMKPINMQAFYSLISIILGKINCLDEKIILRGRIAKEVSDILGKKAEIEPLECDDTFVQNFWPIFDKMAKAAESIKKSEDIFEDHIKDIIERNTINPNVYDFKYWETYAKPTETLFELYDEQKCKLIASPDFVQKVKRKISLPLLKGTTKLIDQLEKMFQKLKDFEEYVEKIIKPLELVGCCINEVENLKRKMAEYELKFKKALAEVYELIDIKLDKRHLPVMKKYYTERIERIEEGLKTLRVKGCGSPIAFPRGSSDICLSCMNWLPRADNCGKPTRYQKKAPAFQVMENVIEKCVCKKHPGDSTMTESNQVFSETDAIIHGTGDNLIDADCDRSIRHFCKGEFALKRCQNIIRLHTPRKKFGRIIDEADECRLHLRKNRNLKCPDDRCSMRQGPQVIPLCQQFTPSKTSKTPPTCSKTCSLKYFKSILCLKTQKCDRERPRDDFVLPEYLRDYRTNKRRTCKVGYAMKNCKMTCTETGMCVQKY